MANCVFARRRYAKDVVPTLLDLFTNMNIVATAGVNSSTQAASYITADHVPSGTCYFFAIHERSMSIIKCVNGELMADHVKSYKYSSTMTVYKKTNVTPNQYGAISGTAPSSGTSNITKYYGATIILVTFPYKDEYVEQLLSAITINGAISREQSSQNTISTSTHNKTYYIATRGEYFDLLQTTSSSYQKINGTATDAATISGTTISMYVYGGTIDGIT